MFVRRAETLEHGFTPSVVPGAGGPRIARWNAALSAPWFRHALRRLLADRPGSTEARRAELKAARVAVFALVSIQSRENKTPVGNCLGFGNPPTGTTHGA